MERETLREQKAESVLVGNGKFLLGRKIGAGAFGDVYIAICIATGEEVAVKLEKVDDNQHQLIQESHVYKKLQGEVGVPMIKWCGDEGGIHIMISELLGPSLADLLAHQEGKFSLKTVIQLGEQMITRVEVLHEHGFIHRDIKPGNFLMGLGKKGHILYIIDFGLSKMYKCAISHSHIGYRQTTGFIGTAVFASINSLCGVEQSRRDDLEALVYMLIYLLKGELPWQHLTAETRMQTRRIILEMKRNMSIDELCRGLPQEFNTILIYARSLSFTDKPDYGFIRQTLRSLYVSQGFKEDCVFDWNCKPQVQISPVLDDEVQDGTLVQSGVGLSSDYATADEGSAVQPASLSDVSGPLGAVEEVEAKEDASFCTML